MREQPKTPMGRRGPQQDVQNGGSGKQDKGKKVLEFVGWNGILKPKNFFLRKESFKHSCLGENSNFPLSMIHFTINLCLRGNHVRKGNSSFRLLRKGAAQSTPGPHQPILTLQSILS